MDNTIEFNYNPEKYMINIVYEENRKTDLPKLFDFIEKNKVKVLCIEGKYNYRVSQTDFNDLLKYISINKTLIEINLHTFGYLIKHNCLEIDIKDLLQRHTTLQTVYLTPYSLTRNFSHVIHK